MAGVGAERLIIDDGQCFACGPNNERGLQLDFVPLGGDGAQTTVTLASHLQGYREIAHGGIVMMLLDEVMAHACRCINEKAMTASVDVRFRAPVPLGKLLVVRGRYKERRRKFLYLEGTVSLADTVLASAEGTFVSLGPLVGESSAVMERAQQHRAVARASLRARTGGPARKASGGRAGWAGAPSK